VKHRATIWAAMLWLAGCATTGAARPGPATESAASADDGAAPASDLARLTKAFEEQSRHVAELETRLALLESEAREARERSGSAGGNAVASAKPTETVRISARHREEARAEADTGPVPLVRLHEDGPAFTEPLALPAPPPGMNARLPIVPLPEDRAKAITASAAASSRDQYRNALRLVRERRWDEAERELDAFLQRFPSDDLSAGATYWRGEVYYAQRRYREALQEFQAVISRFAPGDKAADSLLKLGMCHLRLGDQSSAQRYFKQVIEKYPTSDAARIASREGAT
jgi:tol-pal system protein YbgF